MGFYLYRKQEGTGCDYTIACGQDLRGLNAQSLDAALAEVQELFKKEDLSLRPDGSNSGYETVLILELSRDVTGLIMALADERDKAAQAERDKAELERLRQRFAELEKK